MKKKKSNPLITVYITNRDYGKYLNKAIKSVLTQSLKNFELIIIDDGSKDNSKKIINKYKNDEKVIPIYQNKKGLAISNNVALKLSRGKYIMRLDADDWLDYHALEILSDKLEKNPKIGLVFPDYFEVDETGEIIELVRRHDFKKVKLLDQPAHGACSMIRKECLKRIGGYNEDFSCQDGYYIWVKIIEKFEIANVNLPLFYYRQHKGSLSKNEERILKTRSEIIKRSIESKKITNKSALAIIPIRGLQINPDSIVLKKLRKKPLICWTIDNLLKTKRIVKILVSSPDETILNFLKKKYKKQVLTLRRKSDLAGINVGLDKTLVNAINYAEKKKINFDYVFKLSFRTPFLKTYDLESFINIIELFNTDEVIAVRSESSILYQHDGISLKSIGNKVPNLKLEQNEIYRGIGGLRLFHKNELHNKKSGRKKIGHVVLDQKASYEINSDLDWKIAQII